MMDPYPFDFTDTALQALKAHNAPQSYQDPHDPHLLLIVTPDGQKTFFFQHPLTGPWALGPFPALSLVQARKKAKNWQQRLTPGIAVTRPNTLPTANSTNSPLTLKAFFEEYLSLHAKPYKKSWRRDVAQFQHYLKDWADRPLDSLSRADLQTRHVDIATHRGPFAANRLLALLRTIFNKAQQWERYDGRNPSHGIKKFPEHSRERFLQAHECPRFFAALDANLHPHLADYVRLSLFTGARKGNLLAMQWSQIDWALAVWVIPITKNGSSHRIPLVPEAIHCLKRRATQYADSPWVFPSPRKRQAHWADPQKAWRKLCQQADIDNLRPHDLRRSLGSWQAAIGTSLTIIAKTLAHRNMQTTEIYARLQLEPVRAAVEKATRAMLDAAASEKKEPG